MDVWRSLIIYLNRNNMKIENETLLSEAIDIVNGIDLVLANTTTQYDLDAKNCYDLAEKLERASNLLLVLGDRKYSKERDSIPMGEGVPF